MRDTDGSAGTMVLVDTDGMEVVVSRLPAGRVDLAHVERIARACLAARRASSQLRVGDTSEELRGLLELVGLVGLLGLQPRRQTEGREQLGVEEVVQPGDPLG